MSLVHGDLPLEPPTLRTRPARIARESRPTRHAFEELHAGVRALRAPALARLTTLVTRLVGPRIPSHRTHEQADLCSDVLARIVVRARRGDLETPVALLEAIEAEARALGLADAIAPPQPSWLERLTQLLPELDSREQNVLEGLYLRSMSPTQLAAELGLSASEIDDARRRGLSALRIRLGVSVS